MSTTVPKIDYTNRDYATIKEACRLHIVNSFPNTWQNMWESDLGMTWLETIAYTFDALSFYLDVQANESYLATSKDRSSVIRIGNGLGYNLRTRTGASVTVTATLEAAEAFNVVIPRGTTITAKSGATFRTLEDFRITAGLVTADITMVEGTEYTDTFLASGNAFQQVTLSNEDAIQGTEVVTVGGEEWSRLTSLIYGVASSTVYQIEYDNDSVAKLTFGDGTSGAVPNPGDAISVTYRVGGGVQGNIPVGDIDGAVDGVLEGVTPLVNVNVELFNAERGSGGEERETTAHARMWIPPWLKTNGRAVTLEDYRVLANTFSDPTYGAAAFAVVALKQEIPELNTISIYLWSRNQSGVPIAASTGLKTAMQTYFDNNGEGAVRMVCQDVEILDGENVYVNMDVTFGVNNYYSATDVGNDALTVINEMFENAFPGSDFKVSKIYANLMEVEGVDYCNIENLSVSLETSELIGVGTGAQTEFIVLLDKPSGSPDIVPSTAVISIDGVDTLWDEPGVGLVDINGVKKGYLYYQSLQGYADRDLYFNLDAAPADGALLYITYQYVTDVLRNEIVATVEEATVGVPNPNIRGKLDHAPIVPRDTVTQEKGIAFTDGTQVVMDDGTGTLTGDVFEISPNPFYISYDSGGFYFRFKNTPAVGTVIRAVYSQFLNDKDDLPIEKGQLAVKGQITIATEAATE